MNQNLEFWIILVFAGFVWPLAPEFFLVRWSLEKWLPKKKTKPWLDILSLAITAIFLLAILWGLSGCVRVSSPAVILTGRDRTIALVSRTLLQQRSNRRGRG